MSLRRLMPLVAIFAICINNGSCSKSPSSTDSQTNTGSNPPHDTTIVSPPTDTGSLLVYIGGDTISDPTDHQGSAAYWKNGSLTKLPIGIESYVNSIFVDHSNVYTTVAGSSITNSVTYWKNNDTIRLPDSLGWAPVSYGICVDNDNIYVTGVTHERDLNYGAIYWKNSGQAVHLVPQEVTIHSSWGYGITVSNGDVYIAGQRDQKAICWKNSTASQLPLDTTFGFDVASIASAITISQGDVYVAGTININPSFGPTNQSTATYWKNSVPVRLTHGSVAKAICVSGNDIYIAGGIFGVDGVTRAACWKNGVLTTLNSDYSIANGIAVSGTDVYIVGNIGVSQATYWKNGVPHSLGHGHANAIFVAHG